jgi:hypothetical protein
LATEKKLGKKRGAGDYAQIVKPEPAEIRENHGHVDLNQHSASKQSNSLSE